MTPELEGYGSISQEQISRRGTAGGDRGANEGTGDGRRQSVGSYSLVTHAWQDVNLIFLILQVRLSFRELASCRSETNNIHPGFIVLITLSVLSHVIISTKDKVKTTSVPTL